MDRIGIDNRDAWTDVTMGTDAPVGRRGFLVGSLATGFALAAAPVLAQAVHTGDDGLIAGEVKIPVAGGTIPVYRAMPAGPGKFPTVLVVQEIFGVHEHIKDVCRRLAKLGYFAVAPEMFARQGDVSKLSDIKSILDQVVSKVPDDQAVADLDATVEYARSTGQADTDRLGITGFCWGGRAVWLYAAHNPKVKAGVSWYGLLGPMPWKPDSETMFSAAKRLTAPVLGLYAENDPFIPLTDVEKMRGPVKAKGGDIVVYPGTQHGFHADYRPSYHKGAAEDGWKKLQAWFKTHGV